MLELSTGPVTALKERQDIAMSGKISLAGHSLSAGLDVLCKVPFLVREPQPGILGSPHKLFISVWYFLLE